MSERGGAGLGLVTSCATIAGVIAAIRNVLAKIPVARFMPYLDGRRGNHSAAVCDATTLPAEDGGPDTLLFYKGNRPASIRGFL